MRSKHLLGLLAGIIMLALPVTSTAQQGPRGFTGARGPAGTAVIGTVTTTDPGTTATFSNVGTTSNAIYNVTIPRGSAIYSGTGAPSNALGGNQDYYIRTDTPCLYGPKASGAWPGTCLSLGGTGGSVTASAMQTAVSGLAGCTTTGYAWNPSTNTCTVSSGGSSVSVNGSSVSNPNFSSTTPAAPANSTNIGIQVSGSDVSLYLPHATTSNAGVMKPDGTTITCNAATGVCSSASGVSARIKYVSQLGCAAQDTNLTLGGGTDDTACINAALAAASPSNFVLLWQDGASLISGNGIQGPKEGNWGIIGNGGGLTRTNITSCGISGGVATFVTTPNSFVVGQPVTFESLTHCAALNGTVATVSASGLTSTGFTVSASGTVSTAADSGWAETAQGTGFYYASGSGANVISNSITPSGGGCTLSGTVPSRGANIILKDFLVNGNSSGNNLGNYCFGIHIAGVNDVTLDGVTVYNTFKFASNFQNGSKLNIHNSKFIASQIGPSAPVNTDGIHIMPPYDHITLSDNYFRTNDDSIALNADEGYSTGSGGINYVEISNSTIDGSVSGLRCDGDGYHEVNNVSINNYSGSVWVAAAIFGAQPSSADAVCNNIHWSNSSIEMSDPVHAVTPFPVQDSIGSFSISDFTLVSPQSTAHGFIDWGNNSTPPILHQLAIHNLAVEYTSAGSNFGALFYNNAAAGAPLGTVTVDGFNILHYGATGTTLPCLICNAAGTFTQKMTADSVYFNNIDPTSITAIVNQIDVPSNITALNGIDWRAAASTFATHAANFPNWVSAVSGFVMGNYPTGTWSYMSPTGLSGGSGFGGTWGIDDATGSFTSNALTSGYCMQAGAAGIMTTAPGGPCFVASPTGTLNEGVLNASINIGLTRTTTPTTSDLAVVNMNKAWSGNAGFAESLGINFNDLLGYNIGGFVATTQLYPTGVGLYVPASLAFTGAGAGGMEFVTRADVNSLAVPGDINFSSNGYSPSVPNIRLPGGTLDVITGGNVSVHGGSNVLYRCTTAGTLPVGALTTATGNCGASADTGLRVN